MPLILAASFAGIVPSGEACFRADISHWDRYLTSFRSSSMSRIWLVDQVVDPLSAQLELALLGLAVQLVGFTAARGQLESLMLP